MGRYGPDKDTVERTLDRRAQQRQLAGAHKQCQAQQRRLAGAAERFSTEQQFSTKQFSTKQQFSTECCHTERSHPECSAIAEREALGEPQALGEHEALFGFDALTSEQVTRREVWFVRLAAVDQWRDRHPDRRR